MARLEEDKVRELWERYKYQGDKAARDRLILQYSRLVAAIDALPKREKIVIALYYYETLTLREIGEVLGVTESRVSQLHTKAILRLKGRLRDEIEPAAIG